MYEDGMIHCYTGRRYVLVGHLITAFMLGCLIGVFSVGFWLASEIDKINEIHQQEMDSLKQELLIKEIKK